LLVNEGTRDEDRLGWGSGHRSNAKSSDRDLAEVGQYHGEMGMVERCDERKGRRSEPTEGGQADLSVAHDALAGSARLEHRLTDHSFHRDAVDGVHHERSLGGSSDDIGCHQASAQYDGRIVAALLGVEAISPSARE
jgi:hypothetical protein